MSDKTLRNAAIRLAHQNPELRKELMPLLQKEASPSDADPQLEKLYAEYLKLWGKVDAYLVKMLREKSPYKGMASDVQDDLYTAKQGFEELLMNMREGNARYWSR